MIRSGAVVLAASFAFSACAGHGIVPSGTSYAPMSVSADRTGATSPCLNPKLGFLFKGAFSAFSVSKTGGTSNLPPYKGFSVKTVFGATTATSKLQFLFCDATGKGDIAGKVKGKAFPPYKGSAGTATLYLEAVNSSASALSFSKTPSITIKGMPKGKSCTLVYLSKLSPATWSATPLNQKVNGTTLTYPSVTNIIHFAFPAGSLFLTVACK